jgi:riboflavin kinase/FMN adenylyltransferase
MPGCVVTIGKYDGVHLGHQKILDVLKQEALRLNLPALVLLSEPQPEEFFSGDLAPPRLALFEEKVALLEAQAIPAVFCTAFDAGFSRQSPREFVEDFLCRGLGMRSVVVGEDFCFGHKRSGSVATLRELGAEQGFDVVSVAPCLRGQERVSSTLVRHYLQAGNCQKVAQLLGRPYAVTGAVVAGRRLGRELGFPTANVALGARRLPMTGIFVVETRLDGETLHGVASLGYNPTVSDERQVKLEVHLLDFAGDLYGKTLQVAFLHKLRDEARYDSLELLKRQIAADVATARRFLQEQDGWPAAVGRLPA